MASKSFIVHYDKREMLEELLTQEGSSQPTYDRVGRLFMALCDFAEYGKTEINMDFPTKVAFKSLAPQIQADIEKYEARCEKNRESGRKGGIAKATKRYQTLPEEKQTLPFVGYTNTDTNTDTDTKTDIKAEIYKEEFEKLWKVYPNKKGKAQALQAYIKARKQGESFEAVENGINSYIQQIQALKTKPEYIKHGSTWFSQKAWNDEYTTNNTPAYPPSELDEVF